MSGVQKSGPFSERVYRGNLNGTQPFLRVYPFAPVFNVELRRGGRLPKLVANRLGENRRSIWGYPFPRGRSNLIILNLTCFVLHSIFCLVSGTTKTSSKTETL